MDALTTRIAPLEELGSYGKYEAGPFAPGYGVTLGNALRRVLLGSLEGAAVTAVQAALATARATDPNTELVLATGGYQPIAAAFAKKLGATIALGTPFEVANGIATGKLAAPTQSGEEKARAALACADGGRIVAAFGDTAADIPLLKLADRAVAVAPDRQLQGVAVAEGWEQLPQVVTTR